MQCLEIIELRSADSNREELMQRFNKLVIEVDKEAENTSIKIYNRVNINIDFSIHLLHNSEKIDYNGSQLGLSLASELKDFGLINHAVWLEYKKVSLTKFMGFEE